MKKTAIFWFRNDLRIKDNTALNKALAENDEVIPLYIIDPNIINSSNNGSAKIKFLFDSLKDITERLSQANSKLIIRYGKSDEQLIKLTQELEITKVYFNRIYDIESEYIDEKIKPVLEDFNLEVFSYKDDIFFDKSELYSTDYFDYKKKLKSKIKTDNYKISEEVEYNKLLDKKSSILSLAVPTLEDYGIDEKLNYPKGGESTANKLLNTFDINKNYGMLDFFDIISPYFEIGNISIRQIISITKNTEIIEQLIKYNYFSFYKNEHLENKTESSYNKFLIWCRGETGNSIVDSCITQINTEYQVNTKIFSYVLDYLIYILKLDTKWIERYLSHKLVNHSYTFLRILLSEYSSKIKYDEKYLNEYIKNYLVQLKDVPDRYLREPDKMPVSLQRTINCIIGKDYPYPLNKENYYQELII